jgi:hypothetical protein
MRNSIKRQEIFLKEPNRNLGNEKLNQSNKKLGGKPNQ